MLNNSKMRLAAFLNYETLFSLSGVSLVRFLPTGARNEQVKLISPFFIIIKNLLLLFLFHFLAISCKKMEKRKAVQEGEGLRA